MARQALSEIDAIFAGVAADTADRTSDEILKTRRIACYGVGPEGLMMRARCMRFMHLGLDAHVVGDMTTPPGRSR
jgi:6-phospho-3-hexuloisomerase